MLPTALPLVRESPQSDADKTMSRIRVLIVDDHPVVRHGLKSMLSRTKDIDVVGEANDAETAVDMIPALQPDVLIMDIRLPGKSGLSVVPLLRKAYPWLKIVILTSYDEDEYLFGALRAGAHAYLLKSVAHEKLATTVRAVYTGERTLSPDLVGRVLQEFEALAQQSSRQEHDLTNEEIKILRLIAAGRTSKEIAANLHWSEVTVKRRIAAILEKLNVKTRAQAVADAARKGII
jgi:DNA-binding NarL/FixJ family response regulator